METTKVQPGEAITTGNTIIIPIIKTALYSVESGQGVAGSGMRSVEKLLVIHNGKYSVFTPGGDDLPVASLLEEFPELADLNRS